MIKRLFTKVFGLFDDYVTHLMRIWARNQVRKDTAKVMVASSAVQGPYRYKWSLLNIFNRGRGGSVRIRRTVSTYPVPTGKILYKGESFRMGKNMEFDEELPPIYFDRLVSEGGKI